MLISDYTYDLPEELIATQPPAERGTTRLITVNRSTGAIGHARYSNLADFVQPGDVVVLNDTKVIKARLIATNAAGKQRELLLLEAHGEHEPRKRRVLYRGKLTVGESLQVGDANVTVDFIEDGGLAQISSSVNLLELASTKGSVPLPPYMHREATEADIERYQTVFAKDPGSVAAPTASLNFTDQLAERITAKGGRIVYLTLHVGLGTFLPIRTEKIEAHKMHSEYFEIPATTIHAIRQAKHEGRTIFAVGTTVARTLEYAAERIMSAPADQAISGEADIFMYPGYKFKLVGALLTNFHAPKSTVLMLAAAFAGWDHLLIAYQEAIKQKYAFMSYGDSMLIY